MTGEELIAKGLRLIIGGPDLEMYSSIGSGNGILLDKATGEMRLIIPKRGIPVKSFEQAQQIATLIDAATRGLPSAKAALRYMETTCIDVLRKYEFSDKWQEAADILAAAKSELGMD